MVALEPEAVIEDGWSLPRPYILVAVPDSQILGI